MQCTILQHPRAEAEKVGDAFVEALGRRLTVAALAEIRRRNALHPEEPCASRSFCDADAEMTDAFARIMGRRPQQHRAYDRRLLLDAWQHARRTSLTEPQR